MAKTILQSMDSSLEIYASSTNPLPELSPMAFSVMEEIGLTMDIKSVQRPIDLQKLKFDYLITVCDGIKEENKNLPLQFLLKLDLEFINSAKENDPFADQLEAFHFLRDEMKTELHYFYLGS